MMFRNRSWVAPLALLTSVCAVACTSVGQSVDEVRDSWRNPTHHGEVDFGGQNPGKFTGEERFHSWTFELSGDADISLETKLITQNLDSVIYLYKKGADGNWGGYIKKDDDGGGNLGSRISRSLKAGEYQLKVKATKSLMTGTFALDASCTGAGCPEIDDYCGPESDAHPTETGYTLECGAKMRKVLITPISVGSSSCIANKLEERAVQFYKDYWNDVYGYDDLADGQEPVVSTEHHQGGGTVVDVDLEGHDEAGMYFVFDDKGNLIYSYQSNQSPDWRWYCEGEETNTDPGDECATDVPYNSDYRVADTETGDGSTSAANVDDISSGLIKAAVREFFGETGADNAEYEFTSWKAGWSEGADVSVTDGSKKITYTVTSENITFRTDENGTDFLCKEY